MICNLCRENKFRTIEQSAAHLVVCKNCGLVFIKNIKKANFYKELYAKHYNYTAGDERNALCPGNRNTRYVEWIKKNLDNKNGLKLLEIGCGFGSLLESLKNEKFQVYGIEPGRCAVEYARAKRGLGNVENCLLEESLLPNGFFDAILLVQTFEHFLDPAKGLLKIRELLKEEGVLFIEVPDAFAVFGVYRWGLEPSHNHLFIYSNSTIRHLLNKCGFEVDNLRKVKMNLQVVAKKAAALGKYPKKYKNHYKSFLLVNCMNKYLLKIVFKLRLIEKLHRSRIISKLMRYLNLI